MLELRSDGFTRADRQKGWIAIHVALACYCFWLIATICDDYFVPAIEGICSGFNLNEDVGKCSRFKPSNISPNLTYSRTMTHCFFHLFFFSQLEEHLWLQPLQAPNCSSMSLVHLWRKVIWAWAPLLVRLFSIYWLCQHAVDYLHEKYVFLGENRYF